MQVEGRRWGSHGSIDSKRWGDIKVGDGIGSAVDSRMGLDVADKPESENCGVLSPDLVCAQQKPER